MYSRIWVTGGTGTVGKALEMISPEFPGREFIFSGSKDCDLTNQAAVLDFVQRHKPDAILHLAALSGGIAYSAAYPATLLHDNVLMDLNVLEAARHCAAKVVMTLSVAAYPLDAALPLKEDNLHAGLPHEGSYSYSFAKRLIEPEIRAYRRQYNLNAIGLIPAGIFGEYSSYAKESAIMLAALIRRFYEEKAGAKELTVWGDGSPLREYTYAKDIARIFMWCLDNYHEEQILNIGTSEEHSVKETAFMIAEFMDIDPARITFDTSKPKGVLRRGTDNSRFTALSHFKYTPFREGLKNTIAWFSAHYNDPSRVRL